MKTQRATHRPTLSTVPKTMWHLFRDHAIDAGDFFGISDQDGGTLKHLCFIDGKEFQFFDAPRIAIHGIKLLGVVTDDETFYEVVGTPPTAKPEADAADDDEDTVGEEWKDA